MHLMLSIMYMYLRYFLAKYVYQYLRYTGESILSNSDLINVRQCSR